MSAAAVTTRRDRDASRFLDLESLVCDAAGDMLLLALAIDDVFGHPPTERQGDYQVLRLSDCQVDAINHARYLLSGRLQDLKVAYYAGSSTDGDA